MSEAGLVEHLRALDRIARENGGERAAGTAGYAASADYVAERLRRAGWRVRRQRVPMTLWREGAPARMRLGSATPLEPGRDFLPPSYSGSGRADGKLRLVASGCSESDYDDVRRGDVAFASFTDCFLARKAALARRAGAGALVITTAPSKEGVPRATLVAPTALPVALLNGRFSPRPGQRVRLSVDAVSERGSTENVIADSRGGGERVVMAGGHLDSVYGGPGINDNGSGVATLIEVAEALGPRPSGARVRLGFWGGEEEGLVGSRRYVRELPRAERERIAAYLNLDMVGSPNPVPAVYDDGDERLEHLLREAHPGGEEGLAASGLSDHTAFDNAGIATGGLYTGAEEEGPNGRPRDACYHLACDTLANVDRATLLAMARATERALRRLAQAK